tara:strand:- start:344 stop:541 length:198 start_codon:yes stop_codon:yes gene_type:complete
MKQLNIGRSINKKKVKKMTKVIEKNVAEILILIVFALVMSSCQTVKEMNMTGSQRATQCNWVNYK